ncbi:unnamed protein product [Rotaria magnacalcarata]|uniref:Uncharacterized protein n=3 Tax=Rotaria magnacalcarata TaxID=392030 RepID=A0A816HH45_9BILA|nr:unnamed protein product [Rotaria magnacalcarata]CAF1685972.1 unnamed protein product [Rotaria magnacalcarata]CAF2056926.1 unnamed protein product [Rotaria magnacalcarata]CAF2120063.1 unnamed protein product [Rotaria magnacalcarata]CAF2144453.1 unnamed protein product [Rotaria magnacalcarata]
MSFNDWLSSSSISRLPLSTTTNFNGVKQQHHYHYHHHYHYQYAPMTTTIGHPSYNNCQHQCCQQYDNSNSFTLVPPMSMLNHQILLKYKENFHQNSTLKLRRSVALFLHLIDNSSISDFLQYDRHFRHADKYLLAMTLIYFWRAKLREHHYTKDSFYLALWLAHDSVEEDLRAKYGLLPWALQTNDGRPSVDLKNDFKRFLSKKNDLWTRMGFRARVTKDECDEIMLVQPNHWLWQRERSTDYNKKMALLNRKQKNGTFNSEDSCSSTLLMSPVDDTKSIMIVDDINPDNVSWTSDDETDEIIILD